MTGNRPHTPFTLAVEMMLAKPEDRASHREMIGEALIGEGLDVHLAFAVAAGMVAGASAATARAAHELSGYVRELRAYTDELAIADDEPDASPGRVSHWPPVVQTRCADCEVGTLTIGEFYMVRDDVWQQAWKGRAKPWQHRAPGQMMLCVGCLETRLGRKLCAADFTDAPLNDPSQFTMSARLLDRLQWPTAHIGKPPVEEPPPQPDLPPARPKKKKGRLLRLMVRERRGAPGEAARREEAITNDNIDRRLEGRFALSRRIAGDRRGTKSRTSRSQAATRSATALLRQAHPATRFEIGSVSFDKVTHVHVIWSSGPSSGELERALAPLTAGGGTELQLQHESELSRRSRLALRAAYQVLGKDLELSDTAETLGAKLTEKLRDIIPSREGRLS
jgi:hypothetical protein